MTAESSPEGHWSKNFAALSIHRREDWAVTMKGFNRFVWDFEQGKGPRTQNLHGIFQSHGQMIIANNEESLKAHDIENGWDWTKIPGATTMNLSLYETLLKKARYFSPRSSAGGVTFIGPEPIASGLFAMDFHQPDYQFLNVSDRHRNMKLYFKKSVFFFQSVLVCLGSNIKIENGSGKEAQTTLFQDKLQRGSSTFTIEVDGVTKGMSAPFPAETPALSSEGYITLTDTKGNSYYIPSSSASSLKVKVENQSSKTPADKPSSGYYATAWFEHSSSDDKYEYAIYVKTPSYPKSASDIWKSQATSTTRKVYTVLKQDNKAHVVKFEMTTERWNWIDAQYGYAIFGSIMELPAEGPIKAVSKDCLIMAKEDSKFVYLSISYPDLAFPTPKPLEKIQDIKVKEEYKMESEDTEVQVTLRYDVLKTLPTKAYAHGSPAEYLPIVRVESPSSPKASKGNRVVFVNLKDGFSVEVKLRK